MYTVGTPPCGPANALTWARAVIHVTEMKPQAFFSWSLTIITMRRNSWGYTPYANREEGSNMASESVATETRPTDVGFKRELGLIGATWASETSIIGSGWLFAPLTAALLIGGGAWLAWIIAAVVVIILALAHA